MSFPVRYPDSALALHVALLSHSRLNATAVDLATHLAGTGGADRGVIGLIKHAQTQVSTRSHAATINAGQELATHLAVLAAAWTVPLPYDVTAPVRLEGTVLRALAAPYDNL